MINPLDLFEYQAQSDEAFSGPLAERMRPESLQDFFGSPDLTGKGSLLRQALENDYLFSMILWGPPGCGKTTLARLIAGATRSHFVHFSAVLSGVREIRSVIDEAKKHRQIFRKKTVLFVDEIHRFNKAQQDAFLHHVESGLITLIGATTENPSFEVIAPLLSRCRVIVLKALSDQDLAGIIGRALDDAVKGLGTLNPVLDANAKRFLIQCSDGDARTALNNLEIAAFVARARQSSTELPTSLDINLQDVEKAVQQKALRYDKSGEEHFNLISAFHKSLRGSDPDAALYWLGRMLKAGEDPFYIARRMVRFASEDIGIADPHALTTALNAVEAYKFLGSPEGDLALCQAAVYLAASPKSNRIYVAYKTVLDTINRTGALPVPLHIRNAPTKLMKTLGYGKGYKYAHDFKGAYVSQEYLPEKLRGASFYTPTERGYEKAVKQKFDTLQQKKD